MVAGTVTLLGAGRVFGIFELFVLGAGTAGLVVAGALTLLTRRVDLDATRTVRPTRIHVGDDSRVELAIVNRGSRVSPVLAVRDTFAVTPPHAGVVAPDIAAGGRRQARFLLAPLGAGRGDQASYRLPAERRGIFAVGPLEAEVSDPFGLWSSILTIAPTVELTVYPAVEPLAAAIHSRGDDPTSGAPRPATIGPNGEDLYGLRPYQVGDDLRRVHWPSTARTGELVVRQLELPWQGRATVLLDVRGGSHTAATLESAVSAAASILSASWSQGALVRLATTDGTDSGFAAGHAHFEAVMEHLAVVGTGRDGGLEAVVGSLHRAGNGGSLAVVTTTTALATDFDRMAGLRGRFGGATIVAVDDPAMSAGGPRRPFPAPSSPPGGVTVLRVAAGTPLSPLWDRAFGPSWGRAGHPVPAPDGAAGSAWSPR